MTAKQYVREVMKRLALPRDIRKRIEDDLTSDINAALEQGEQMQQIIRRMGTPQEMADELNESYCDLIPQKPYTEYRTNATLWGLPLVHVVKLTRALPARGVGFIRIASFRGINIGGRTMGAYDAYGNMGAIPTAKGIVAIGPKAMGLISLGFFSMGLISAGIMSLGLLSLGILSLGLLSLGVVSLGALALGISVIAFAALGLSTVGYMSLGIAAAGYYALGAKADGVLSLALKEAENAAQAVAGFMNRLMMPDVPSWVHGFFYNLLAVSRQSRQEWIITAIAALLLAILLSLPFILGYRRAKRDTLERGKSSA